MTRFRPAAPISATASTGAHAEGPSAATMYNSIQTADALTDWLQETQAQRFVEGQDIVEVFKSDLFWNREEVQSLPSPQVRHIVGVLENQFRMMYENCIYQKTYGNDEAGRLDRLTSWTEYRDTNKPSANGFRISTEQAVASVTTDGPIVEVFFDEEQSIVFRTEDDVSDFLDAFNQMAVLQYTDKEAAVMEEISDVDHQPTLEISFRNEPAPRHYTAPSPIDSETTQQHIEQLRRCPTDTTDSAVVDTLDAVLDEGYFKATEQLEIARFLAGHSPVARLRYFYSVPELIDQLARVTDAEMAYIPQREYMILSADPIPSAVTALNDSFPEKQTLTKEDQTRLNSLYEEPDHALKQPPSLLDTLEEREVLLSALENGALSKDEVVTYHLTGWHPKPTEEAMYAKVKDGDAVRTSFEMLSATGFTFHEAALNSVRLAVGTEPTDTDVYPCTRFRPRYLDARIDWAALEANYGTTQ